MPGRPFHVYALLYPTLTGNTWTRFWIEHHTRTFAREGWRWTLPENLELGPAFLRALDRDWTRAGGGREAMAAQILEQVRRTHRETPVDLFYAYATSGQLSPEALAGIRSLEIPTVLLTCDNMGGFEHVEEIAPKFDCVWYCEKQAGEKFRRAGARAIHLPLAADPEYCSPAQGVAEAHDVVFMGALVGRRTEWLGPLADEGFDLVHYGYQPRRRGAGFRLRNLAARLKRGDWLGLEDEWATLWAEKKWADALASRRREGVPDSEVNRVFQEARVTLGLNDGIATDAAKEQRFRTRTPKLRDIEAPMAGACYLTGDCSDLRDCYEIGEEVFAYTEPEDMIDQVRRLLGDAGLRAKTRAKGRQAALSRHTLRQRLVEIFKFLGLSWPK